MTMDEENKASLASYSDDDGSSDDNPSTWPRSYRKSMDMITRTTHPTTNLIPRSSSQTLFNKKHNNYCNESFCFSTNKPLLSQSDYDNEELHISTLSKPNQCSFFQSVLNGINVLCGVGLLTMPYAIKEGGWFGLFLLMFFGIITCYTGILLKRCLESSSVLHTYPDIGQAAFGTTGRVIISILLYAELYASCVEFIIMMSDNLSGLFPNTTLTISGTSFDSTQIFAVLTTVIVLPTVWLKNLSLLSYLSVGGVLSSILLALCLFWVGSVDGLGFHLNGGSLNLANLPVAIGIFGFGFEGHAVFPNLYSSMKDPSKFSLLLITCFGFSTLFYLFVAACGYTIFGDAIQSQFTLNMPKQFISSKIAIWIAVVTPLTKYALTITPVVLSLEELLPFTIMKSYSISMLIRTILVISTLIAALTIPFFAIVAALMGSFLSVLVAIIFPCLCYLSILKGRVSNTQVGICIFIIIFGLVAGCCGTYSAIARLIGNMN